MIGEQEMSTRVVGHYKGVPVVSSPFVPKDIVYVVPSDLEFSGPRRKNGQPDMRFSLNKLLYKTKGFGQPVKQ